MRFSERGDHGRRGRPFHARDAGCVEKLGRTIDLPRRDNPAIRHDERTRERQLLRQLTKTAEGAFAEYTTADAAGGIARLGDPAGLLRLRAFLDHASWLVRAASCDSSSSGGYSSPTGTTVNPYQGGSSGHSGASGGQGGNGSGHSPSVPDAGSDSAMTTTDAGADQDDGSSDEVPPPDPDAR